MPGLHQADPELPYCLDQRLVQTPVGDDHAPVGRQLSPVVELERPARDVGDDSAGFGDDQGARGVVPDLLTVVGSRRQPQVDVGLAAGDHGVLRLAVHSQRRGRDPQPSGDGRRVSLGTMTRLDRLAEPRIGRLDRDD